jgi:hypothetical protein
VLRAVRQGDGFVLDCAPLVTLDPDTQSTRGSVEPSLARLADGRPLLVFRGSNQDKFDLPSYTWYSLSSDEGRSWSPPAPWTYDDGTPFFSPSAHSQLVPHSSGRLFWIGNICGGSVARGNDPRYPLVVGEVDVHTGLLIRSSVTTIADRQPDQPAGIQFSNFGTYEDRVTHELVLDVPHFYPNRAGTGDTGDLFRYRLRVE